jgi:hypothetical protein
MVAVAWGSTAAAHDWPLASNGKSGQNIPEKKEGMQGHQDRHSCTILGSLGSKEERDEHQNHGGALGVIEMEEKEENLLVSRSRSYGMARQCPRNRISCESKVDVGVTPTNPTTASTTPWERWHGLCHRITCAR